MALFANVVNYDGEKFALNIEQVAYVRTRKLRAWEYYKGADETKEYCFVSMSNSTIFILDLKCKDLFEENYWGNTLDEEQ